MDHAFVSAPLPHTGRVFGRSYRMLFVTSGDPSAPGTGHGVYTRSVLRLLKKSGRVDVLDVVQTCHPPRIVPRRARRLLGLGHSFISRFPARIHAARSASLMREVKDALRSDRYDLVLFNQAETLWCVDEVSPRIPKVLVSHNVDSELCADRVRREIRPGWYQRLLLRDAERFARLETTGASRMQGIWTISTADAHFFAEVATRAARLTVPPTFETRALPDPRRADAGGSVRLGYLANMTFGPNRFGAEWLINEVMPALGDAAIELHLFGMGTERFHAVRPSIFGHGFVPDINDIYRSIDVVACPIHSGGGVNVKFVEALYRGKPMIATRFSARGLPPIDAPRVVFLDTSAQWSTFLRTSGADLAARASVTDGLCQLFEDATHLPEVVRFLDSVAA